MWSIGTHASTCAPQGNFLYQEDLATLLAELFADVVDPKEDTTAEEAIQEGDTE